MAVRPAIHIEVKKVTDMARGDKYQIEIAPEYLGDFQKMLVAGAKQEGLEVEFEFTENFT